MHREPQTLTGGVDVGQLAQLVAADPKSAVA